MKQKIFTLLMMLALMVVVGSAYALNDKTVVAGGLYHYSLTGVKVATATGSTLTVSYSNNGSVTSLTHGGTSMTNGGALPSANEGIVTFDITYDAATAASGNINVIVKDGGAHGCTNNILLAIVVNQAPTVDLAITDVTDDCQTTGAAGDETDAVSASTGNTLGYATTINMTHIPGDYSGTATLTLSGTGTTGGTKLSGIKIAGLHAPVTGFTYTTATDLSGTLTWDENAVFTSGVASLTFDVTFTTTEGLADVNVTITATAVSVTENTGNHLYAETGSGANDQTTARYAMPSIGAWGN